MANRKGIKYLWGPVRALLRKLPEREVLLVLSVVTGLLCGLAAVLLVAALLLNHLNGGRFWNPF